MMYLSANLKKYRIMKELTQDDVAEYLGITAQSVSKWERGESCPDITFLPALANIFETSVDLLLGMDTIRAEETRRGIHGKAVALSTKEKQKATIRAALCFLYLKAGKEDKANALASRLPHMRESREVIQPLVQSTMDGAAIEENVRKILLGE